MTAACPWCGVLPRGTGGSVGQHRRDCPGRDEDEVPP